MKLLLVLSLIAIAAGCTNVPFTTTAANDKACVRQVMRSPPAGRGACESLDATWARVGNRNRAGPRGE